MDISRNPGNEGRMPRHGAGNAAYVSRLLCSFLNGDFLSCAVELVLAAQQQYGGEDA